MLRGFLSDEFPDSGSDVIEVNAAGTLTPYLQLLPRHALHAFPEIDLQSLNFADDSIEVIIHSDTLEHVPDSKVALKESHRVLKPGGRLFYTVPIVVGRMTRKRNGLPASYHGKPGVPRPDYTVQTEYGADFWCEIFEAGFRDVANELNFSSVCGDFCYQKLTATKHLSEERLLLL